MPDTSADGRRVLLRHAVATLAYRGRKALDGAPASFAEARASETSRSAVEILAHVADVLTWAASLARGQQAWNAVPAGSWEHELARFYESLARLDDCLAVQGPLGLTEERLFQGPVADALTHVGQLALLRRVAGVPVRGENYSQAEVRIGRVGPDQTPPAREF